MPQVSGFNAQRAKAIEDTNVIDAELTTELNEPTHLILKPFGMPDIDAGEAYPPEIEEAGGYYKIAEQAVTSGTTALLDFSGIPQTYKVLKIFASLRCDGAALIAGILMNLNNITTNGSYYRQYLQGIAAAVTAAETLGVAGSRSFGVLPGASASGSNFANVEITIYDYTSSKMKIVDIRNATAWGGASGQLMIRSATLVINSTAAINRIALGADNGNLVAGSIVSVYGIKSAATPSVMTRYAFDGQSLGYSPFVTEQAYPYKFMQTARPGFKHLVANLPGTLYSERDPSLRGRLDWFLTTSPHVVLIDDGGTYDLDTGHGGSGNSATVLATKTAYTAARRAAGADYIVGLTIPPTGIITAGEETARLAVNAALVANPGTYGYDEIVNLGAIPQLTDWTNTAYFYDGTHYTDAATTLVANALAATGI